MLPSINPTTTKAWQLLQQHAAEIKKTQMKEMFRNDPERFKKFSMCLDEIVFDYSKNIISEKTIQLLLQLAEECKVHNAIKAMFNGDIINATEKRAVLHVALRNFSNDPVYAEGIDIMPAIRKVLGKMKSFSNAIHKGKLKGYTGKKIKYIVNIGIGGSDLGPLMVTEALKPYWVEGIQTYFVSNVDGSHIAETLKKVKADQTLFLIASKTFTTQETMTNAHTARDWFLKKAKKEKFIANHFIALSTNEEEAVKFGIDKKNIFGFWDWVGGRYSLWSAVGMSIALTVGYKNFEQLLKGAHTTDLHFSNTPFEKNITCINGITGDMVHQLF